MKASALVTALTLWVCPPLPAQIVYFCDAAGNVGQVDTSTLAASTVGSLPAQGFSIGQGLGLAYDPARDQLLYLDRSTRVVYVMDPATGTAAVLFNPPSEFQGGAVVGDDLWGINEGTQTFEAYSLVTFVLTVPGAPATGHTHGLGVDALTGQLFARNSSQAIYQVSAAGAPGPTVLAGTGGVEDIDPLGPDWVGVDYGRELNLIDGVTGAESILLNSTQLSAVGVTGSMSGVAVRQIINSLYVRIVDTAPTLVTAGQTGILVTMELENTGPDPLDLTAIDLRFLDAGMIDVTLEYTVTPDLANPSSIGATSLATALFAVDISLTPTLGTITLDGSASGINPVTLQPHGDTEADTTDAWDVVPCLVSLCGDCTGDGAVTILDALTAAQHSASLITLTGAAFSNCNVTGLLEPDPAAAVTILDALTLAQYAAGIGVAIACC
jgi:hypothetical protein